MLASKPALALISLIVVALGRPIAHAQAEPWLALRSLCSSEGASERLMNRLRDATLGVRASDLRASVAIEGHDGRYRVVLRIMRGATTVGAKRLVASSCDEAEEAALAVLALALSDLSQPEHAPVPEPLAPAPVEIEPIVTASIVDASEHDAAPDAALPPAGERTRFFVGEQRRDGASNPRTGRALGLSFRGGVDVGTLPVRTAYLGAAISRFFGPFALRAVLGVGLPYAEVQQSDDGLSERVRGDFALLDLGLCYGLGTRFKFAACGGGDLSVVRRQRSVSAGNEADRVTSQVEPVVAGVIAAILGYPLGAIQPELELSAAMAFGDRPGASWLAVRAGAGASVHF